MSPVRQGPAWSDHGLDLAAGRYPLGVERQVMRMAEALVPAVTTVTPHARYYTLHALVADEGARRGLAPDKVLDLLRRAEVCIAAVSSVHEHPAAGIPRAHGADALAAHVMSGRIDLAVASTPGKGGYVRSEYGFWGPYVASEVALGLVTTAGVPEPGPELDAAAVRAGLGGVLDLVGRDVLDAVDLGGHGDLCVCAGGSVADGRWFARRLCGSPDVDPRSSAGRRRGTIRLLARVISTCTVVDVTRDFGRVVAFEDWATSDEVAATLDVTLAWRGLVLRNYSVGAWRRLWSWLVDQVIGLTTAEHVGDAFAAELPASSVRDFLDDLPATLTATGALSPAEVELRASDWAVPRRELAVLAVNARRAGQLDGKARAAFVGDRPGADLAPEWMARRLAAAADQPVRDFARDLTRDLLARAQRIALRKAQRRPDGRLWLPTRLHQRGDLLYAEGREGSGDVGLRLDQLTTVLAGAGALARRDGRWSVTEYGQALLG